MLAPSTHHTLSRISKIFSPEMVRQKNKLALPLIRQGANLPSLFSNAYPTGTVSQIDLKPGCKFEYVHIHCLNVYKKQVFQNVRRAWKQMYSL